MICAMRDITSRQLCLGKFDGSGTRWHTPHFVLISFDQASRLNSARSLRKVDFTFPSVGAWHDVHSLRCVVSRPFAASRYVLLNAKLDSSRRARESVSGAIGAVNFNNIAPASATSSAPTPIKMTRLEE